MRLYGLIGKTLSHSFSKGYFAKKFATEGIADCAYESFELSNIDEFPRLISSHPELCGLNVTIPYKEAVLPFLDEQSEDVEAIGACNCIKVQGGKLIGYNTDAYGFKTSIKPHLKSHHQQALVFGSGGASKAIQYVLKELGIRFKVVSRKPLPNELPYEAIDKEVLKAHTLLVNTTPLGMYPNIDSCPLIPYKHLTSAHFLYDAVYNPVKTLFLEKGERQGAQICNGYQMLIEQAEESWRIWNAMD
jgi:shikimate dehydrogenase